MSHYLFIYLFFKEHSTESDDPKDQPTAQDQPMSNRLQCNICYPKCSNIWNLRRHEKIQHHNYRQPIFCIDVSHGIFVTPKNQHGPRVPFHICKSILTQTMSCEVDICCDPMSFALKRCNPRMECQHLKRTNQAVAYISPPSLTDKSLQLLSDRGPISRTRNQECWDLNEQAHIKETDSVFLFVFFPPRCSLTYQLF